MSDWQYVEAGSGPNRVMMVDLDRFRALAVGDWRLPFKVRVMELCGPISGFTPDYDRPYYPFVIFAGVKLETALRWLRGCGWGAYLAWMPEQEYEVPARNGRTVKRILPRHQVNDTAPMRLRLKGRCWIEDPDRPATLVRGPYDPVDLPARVRAAAEEALDAARARLRPQPRRRKRA